jgi:uncharacterized protein (DUF58 family)
VSAALDDALRIAAALGPLRLSRARARQGRHAGQKPRRTAGSGNEFWQYRLLEVGEAADAIDWRRSARSDELYVREHQREDPVRFWLAIDTSPSMDFASAQGPTKRDAALTIGTALALAAIDAGEQCSAVGDGGVLSRARAASAFAPTPQPPVPTGPLGRDDVLLIAGDFLDENAFDWVDEAARRGASGAVLFIADPAEIAFPYRGRVRFEAVEPGDPALEVGRAETLAERYRVAWLAHRTRIARHAGVPGWRLFEHSTDSDAGATARAIAQWLSARP